MNLKKAREILEINFGGIQPLKDPDLSAAVHLGIEALKRVKHVRDTYQKSSYILLPGETED